MFTVIKFDKKVLDYSSSHTVVFNSSTTIKIW